MQLRCSDATKMFRLICHTGMDDSDITVAVASIVIAVPLFIAVTAVAVACYIVYRRYCTQAVFRLPSESNLSLTNPQKVQTDNK